MNALKKHQLIAFSSFVILAGVLFYLTYNTFVLKDRQYQLREKTLLKELYNEYVGNDNIYPGGYRIVSKYIEANICSLEELYLQNKTIKGHFSDSLLLGLFTELRNKNPMDSIFSYIEHKHALDKGLKYLLTINSIKIRFNRGLIIPIYEEQNTYAFLDRDRQTSAGYIVGGDLKSPMHQNRITSLFLSSSLPYSYDISFTLYADTEDRYLNIFKSALPVLILALLALTATIYIYYITFKNWIRQKKLAEMKSDFINSITHEFNTPISTILVANKSLQNETITQNKQNISELTEIIARQSSRLQTLFNQVLDITEVDKDLEKEPVNLTTLIKETIKDYHFKITDQNVTIQQSGLDSEDPVHLNKFWVTTMLFNIFDNAVKYNNSKMKCIHISFWSEPDEYFLRISDNGIGMEQDTIKNIFDKFYRGNKKRAGQIKGLGLGLYYTQHCIQVHGWKLTVNSKPATGSEFTIIIPRQL